ncbi:MAG: hypothetical protein WBM86_00090, partial [Waterburya sp.]
TYKYQGYQAEVANEQALFQRITGEFLKNKYFYMKGGYVPRNMKPEQFDRKIIKQFKISFFRRKGVADVQYVRLGTAYLLVARNKGMLKNNDISGVIDVRENAVDMAQWRMKINKRKKLAIKEIKDGEETKRELKVKFPRGLTTYNKQSQKKRKKKKTTSKQPTSDKSLS